MKRALFICVFFLSGCALFQKPVTPETPRQSLAVAEITYQGLLGAVNDLIDAGQVDADDATDMIVSLTEIKTGIDAARLFLMNGQEDQALRALGYLNAAIAVLSTKIQELKNERQHSQGP